MKPNYEVLMAKYFTNPNKIFIASKRKEAKKSSTPPSTHASFKLKRFYILNAETDKYISVLHFFSEVNAEVMECTNKIDAVIHTNRELEQVKAILTYRGYRFKVVPVKSTD